MGTTSTVVATIASLLDEMPTVMTTSFIRQQINLEIHDIMHQLSGQLFEIVKPMVQNEMQ